MIGVSYIGGHEIKSTTKVRKIIDICKFIFVFCVFLLLSFVVFVFCVFLLLAFVVFYFWLLWFTKDAKGCRCFMGSPMGANGVHPVGRAKAMVALTI